MEPTVIYISGPPAGYKSRIAMAIRDWALEELGEEVYISEEDGAVEHGDKDKARFHIFTKQT